MPNGSVGGNRPVCTVVRHSNRSVFVVCKWRRDRNVARTRKKAFKNFSSTIKMYISTIGVQRALVGTAEIFILTSLSKLHSF